MTDKTDNPTAPVVSVLVLTYNHGKEIAQCLDSILRQQTDFPFEIILGEDGSTDGTQEICRAYARRYPDIIRLSIRDQAKKVTLFGRKMGKYNLKQTLREGTGKYFAFLDGDDYWTDDRKLQKQVDFLERHEEYSLCSTHREVLQDGEFFPDKVLERAFAASGNQPIEVTTDNLFRNYVKTSSVCFRKELLDFDVLAREYTAVNDTFIFYMLVRQRKGIILPWRSSVYRLHTGGRWSTLSRFQQVRLAFHTVGGLYRSTVGDDPVIKEVYARLREELVVAAIKDGEYRELPAMIKTQPVTFFWRIPRRLLAKVVGR